MFPRTAIRRVADALLEAADAALSPDDAATPVAAELPGDHGTPATSAAVAAAPAPASPDAHLVHPHRTRLRIERVRRRGALPPRAQHCITPIARPATPSALPAASRGR
jgi:hypothetical protein